MSASAAPMPVPASSPAPTAVATATVAAAAAQDHGLQFRPKDFEAMMSSASLQLSVPTEIKILCYLLVLFLFLLFLIVVLWDRYGKEIGELYTPNSVRLAADSAAEVSGRDVADEYTVYQKLPTFFYEYSRSAKKKPPVKTE